MKKTLLTLALAASIFSTVRAQVLDFMTGAITPMVNMVVEQIEQAA